MTSLRRSSRVEQRLSSPSSPLVMWPHSILLTGIKLDIFPVVYPLECGFFLATNYIIDGTVWRKEFANEYGKGRQTLGILCIICSICPFSQLIYYRCLSALV